MRRAIEWLRETYGSEAARAGPTAGVNADRACSVRAADRAAAAAAKCAAVRASGDGTTSHKVARQCKIAGQLQPTDRNLRRR